MKITQKPYSKIIQRGDIMKVVHCWNTHIYQPCGATGTYTKYTSTGSATQPYAVSSGYSYTNKGVQTAVWNAKIKKPGYGSQKSAPYMGYTATPNAIEAYFPPGMSSTVCGCSANGIAKFVLWDLYVNPYASIGTQLVCSTEPFGGGEICPKTSAKPYRIKFNCLYTTAAYGITYNWKLYKPKDDALNTHTWGPVYLHTSAVLYYPRDCVVSERITFVDD